MKLFIGCAAYRDVDANTMMSQQRITQPGVEIDGVERIATGVARGYHAPRNAETLAQTAIDGGFTHYLYHDADMEYQPHHVARALDTLRLVQERDKTQKCIVGAMYPSSSGARVLVGKPDASDPEWSNFRLGMTVGRALHIGFGFVLMPIEVFAEMQRPWFADVWNGNHDELVTPDVRFCEAARDLGWTIYADSALDVIHWVRCPLTLKDSLATLHGGRR